MNVSGEESDYTFLGTWSVGWGVRQEWDQPDGLYQLRCEDAVSSSVSLYSPNKLCVFGIGHGQIVAYPGTAIVRPEDSAVGSRCQLVGPRHSMAADMVDLSTVVCGANNKANSFR